MRILNILLTSVCSALPPQLPVPVALFPLDGTYGTKEIDGRQPDGIPENVTLAPGPDGEQNGSYEFSAKSYIKFPNNGTLDIKHSFTILFWGKWFEPRSLSRLCGLIVRVRVVPRRTVVGDIDRRFDNLSGSHHQSHVNCVSSVYGIMSLVSLAVMLLAVLNRTVGWAVMLLAVGSLGRVVIGCGD